MTSRAKCQDFLGGNEENEENRLKHLKIICEKYTNSWHSPTCDDQAIVDLNEAYWSLLLRRVKPYFVNSGRNSRIDRHKIISTMEFAVIGTKPFKAKSDNINAQIEVNADFAVTLACQIYNSFYLQEYNVLPGNYNILKFLQEHKTFLKMSNFEYEKNETPPEILSNLIFSNAATWYGIDEYIKAANNKL